MIPSAPDVLKAFELKNMPFQSNIDTDFLGLRIFSWVLSSPIDNL